mgnify:CR=1 FL=1
MYSKHLILQKNNIVPIFANVKLIINQIYFIMKKTLFILAIAFMTLAESAWADKGFKTLQEQTLCKAVSPSGRYVVGVNPNYSVDGSYSVSFLYDTNNGEIQWLTEFDENDFSKGGDFSAVTDDGVICGTTKDPDLLITFSDIFGTDTRPANSAAIWKNGKATLLYYGDYDTSKFEYLGDGSQAVGLSADGKKVLGYVSTGNYTSFYPCVWIEEQDDTWKCNWLPLPEQIRSCRPYFISADGNTAVGITSDMDNKNHVIIWQDDKYTEIDEKAVGWDVDNYAQMSILSMSPNGEFFVIKRSMQIYIYDVKNGELRKVTSIDGTDEGMNVSQAGIDNKGNMVAAISYGSVFFGDEVYNRPFWYSFKDDRNFDFTYYMQLFADGVVPDFTFDYGEKSQASPVAISSDGSTIVGNVDVYIVVGQKPKCWILKSEPCDVSIPATPEGLKAKSEALGQVELSWIKDVSEYSDLELHSYKIYRDGILVDEVSADKPAAITENNVPAGHPGYSVEAIFERNTGGVMVSPRSNVLKVGVPGTYSMPLFDDFTTGTLETNFWEVESDYGDIQDASWGVMKDYGLIGSSLYYTVFSLQPYSASIVSRPVDATNENTVKVSFFMLYSLLNSSDWDVDKDSLSFDISTDFGDTWKEIRTWSIGEFAESNTYNVLSTDISSDVAGKLFKIRFRKHGQGAAQYQMFIDNIRIDTGESEMQAPTGLTGMLDKDGKSLNLMWHNLSGAYQINYINDPSFSTKYTIGNEGRELIAANVFEPNDLSAYDGKYLSAVSTTLNYYTDGQTEENMHASIVVFEDGVLVREQEIKDMVYNEEFIIPLDEPLVVDASKELRIGIKIFDYNADQLPLLYILSDKFVAGKSDVYSEDNGVTWKKISDFYNEQGLPEQGKCCWNITGCITDIPEITPINENNVFSYNIFRDGIQLNKSVIDRLQTRFTDPDPSVNACYQVVAYNYDGTYSDYSEQFCLDDLTDVKRIIADNIEITRNNGDNFITISGNFDSADLISVNGMCVSRSNGNKLPLDGIGNGLYILRISAGGKIYTQKMIVNN